MNFRRIVATERLYASNDIRIRDVAFTKPPLIMSIDATGPQPPLTGNPNATLQLP
ncbi:hypothetical protein [Thioclava sp.]|uniref:hypothetical protein n=1 Tax=Thioclava sp. TaxID=1933450 RepID=UPI003AA7D011